MIAYDILLALDRLILPTDLLACFDIVKIENGSETMTIYFGRAEPSSFVFFNLSPFFGIQRLSSRNRDSNFPIRDNKVTLYVRRRKWIDRTTHQIICNTLELTANGTRHSKEFASFLKGLLWRNARLRLALLNAIITLTAISLNGSTKNI